MLPSLLLLVVAVRSSRPLSWSPAPFSSDLLSQYLFYGPL